ncbi:MAG: hypothetical protein V4617_11705 [Gemmatimonadota bacterium]
MRNSRTFRPAVSSFVTAAISSTLLFATVASAQGAPQGRPPAPPRAGAGMRDTLLAPRPGEQRMMPGMAPSRMAPGGMVRRGGPGVARGPGQQGQLGQPMSPQAGGPPSPAELLRRRQELGLTPDQVRRLESMQSELGGVLTPDQRAQFNRMRAGGPAVRGGVGRGVAGAPGMQGPARQGPGMQGRISQPPRPAVQGRVAPRGRGLAAGPGRARGDDVAVRRRVEIRQGTPVGPQERAAVRRGMRPGMGQVLGPDRRPGMAPDARRAPRAGMRPPLPPRGAGVMDRRGAVRGRPPVDARRGLRDPRDRRDVRENRDVRELRIRRGAELIEQDSSAR